MKYLILTILVTFCFACTDQEQAVREAERRIDERNHLAKECNDLGFCLRSRARFTTNRYDGYSCEMLDVLDGGMPLTWNSNEFNLASLRFVCEIKGKDDLTLFKKGKKNEKPTKTAESN
jgi:hypothetical protein